MEKNGKASSSKRTRHINIRYFYITDVVKNQKSVDIEYLPTDEILGDFFTKPLAGATFYRMRNLILGINKEDFHAYQKEYLKYNSKTDAAT